MTSISHGARQEKSGIYEVGRRTRAGACRAAWTDYRAALSERKVELAALQKERDALRNRQLLLDRDNVDPDLAGELMRKELNVVAPDEVVVPLK
jgi:cell division protein FtsB